jgi:hypothetical protein
VPALRATNSRTKSGEGIAECRDEIIDVKKAVDTAMAALDKIVAQAAWIRARPSKEFDKSVPKIESAAAKARKRAEDMRREGKEYFSAWEKGPGGSQRSERSGRWPSAQGEAPGHLRQHQKPPDRSQGTVQQLADQLQGPAESTSART